MDDLDRRMQSWLTASQKRNRMDAMDWAISQGKQPKQERCLACNGTGKRSYYNEATHTSYHPRCEVCGGTGLSRRW